MLQLDSQFCATEKSDDWKCDASVETKDECGGLPEGKAHRMYPELPADLPSTCEKCLQDTKKFRWCITSEFGLALMMRDELCVV